MYKNLYGKCLSHKNLRTHFNLLISNLKLHKFKKIKTENILRK